MFEKVLVEIVSGLSLLVIAQLFLHARSLDDDIKEMYSLLNRNCRLIQYTDKDLNNSVVDAACSDMIVARSILLRSFSGNSYTSRFNRLYKGLDEESVKILNDNFTLFSNASSMFNTIAVEEYEQSLKLLGYKKI